MSREDGVVMSVTWVVLSISCSSVPVVEATLMTVVLSSCSVVTSVDSMPRVVGASEDVTDSADVSKSGRIVVCMSSSSGEVVVALSVELSLSIRVVISVEMSLSGRVVASDGWVVISSSFGVEGEVEPDVVTVVSSSSTLVSDVVKTGFVVSSSSSLRVVCSDGTSVSDDGNFSVVVSASVVDNPSSFEVVAFSVMDSSASSGSMGNVVPMVGPTVVVAVSSDTSSGANVVASSDVVCVSIASVDVCRSNSTVTRDTLTALGSVLVVLTVTTVVSGVSVIAGTSVMTGVSVDVSSDGGGHATNIQGKVSTASPSQVPPFLAGMTTARSLFLYASPQVCEHRPQSLHTDHKQSEGSIDTIIDGSVVVIGLTEVGIVESLSTQFLLSGPNVKLGGQVHM